MASAVTTFLRGRGDDVVDVKGLGWFGKTDAELFTRARQEDRLILTYDADFSAQLSLREPHAGILIIRLRYLRPDRVITSLHQFLQQHAGEDLTETIAVIEDTRVRFRRQRRGRRGHAGFADKGTR